MELKEGGALVKRKVEGRMHRVRVNAQDIVRDDPSATATPTKVLDNCPKQQPLRRMARRRRLVSMFFARANSNFHKLTARVRFRKTDRQRQSATRSRRAAKKMKTTNEGKSTQD